jgi:hypothetical protein
MFQLLLLPLPLQVLALARIAGSTATAHNDYQNLIGIPTQLAFDQSQAGVIINAGNLAVSGGQHLTLLAGNVINTGQLTAPSGMITLAAVKGESLVKISQRGHLLSLEIAPPRDTHGQQLPISPQDLPTLLTGGGGRVETKLLVSPTGTVQLSDALMSIPAAAGTTIVSGRPGCIIGRKHGLPRWETRRGESTRMDSSGSGWHGKCFGRQGGIISANINASGDRGGGTVRIGGDFQGKGQVPNASRTFVSRDSVINADALVNGNGGRVVLWADKVMGFYGNTSTRGGLNFGNGGFVEVSSKQELIFRGDVDTSAFLRQLGNAAARP